MTTNERVAVWSGSGGKTRSLQDADKGSRSTLVVVAGGKLVDWG